MRLLKKIYQHITSSWYRIALYSCLVLSIINFAISPSRLSPKHKGKGVHPDYQQCATMFEGLTGRKVVTPIQPGGPNLGNAIGITYFFADGYSEIDIRSAWWATANEYERCSVILHELAHAQCYSKHYDADLPDGCHASMMHSSIDDERCIKKHWNEHLQSIIHVCKE